MENNAVVLLEMVQKSEHAGSSQGYRFVGPSIPVNVGERMVLADDLRDAAFGLIVLFPVV